MNRLCTALIFYCFLSPAQGAIHHVLIEDMKFKPAEVEVHFGDTIVWTNRDFVPHTATAEPFFDSKNLLENKSYRYKVKSHHDLDYNCSLHPVMHGRIRVLP